MAAFTKSTATHVVLLSARRLVQSLRAGPHGRALKQPMGLPRNLEKVRKGKTMEYQKVHEWELALDTAEQSPFGDLPASPSSGQAYSGVGTDGMQRRWVAVQILSGNAGARWAYWAPWFDPGGRAGQGPNPAFFAIADKIFNGDAPHFIGMLAEPYVRGKDPMAWVLTDPKPVGPRIVYEVELPKPARHERYERSREVYDVETGESRMLGVADGKDYNSRT